MNRTFLLLFVLWLPTPRIMAQADFKTKVEIGLSQGVGLSRVAFYPSVDQGLLTGYTGGLLLRVITEPHLGIQLEANYLRRGWTETFIVSGTYKRHQELITVPVMTYIYFGEKSRSRLYFVVGPYLAYLLSDAESLNVSDTLEHRDYYTKAVNRKAEFGVSGGAALAIPTRIGIFELQAKYNHALTNLFKPGEEEFIYFGSRPQTIDITIHYMVRIPSGKK